ncbi:MAG TPA: cyclic nucleotide-binding domain-containing protein [Vicinamibacterales bacterium]|nr:cyclic nucleotide-binding domain-containing protein [Vicinamibacterales bacterium]
METLEPLLAEHPFSRTLQARHLQVLVGCASNVRFEAGAFLFREGQAADRFYLIREGKVAIEIAAPTATLTMLTVEGGEVLGWSWLFPPYRWKFDARAIEPTRAIALDAQCLRAKCEADHDLGYDLLKQFALMVEQRLHATRLQLLNAYDVNA